MRLSEKVILVTGPAHAGAFTLNANGTFSYSHDGSESASDVLNFSVDDGHPQLAALIAADEAVAVQGAGFLNEADLVKVVK